MKSFDIYILLHFTPSARSSGRIPILSKSCCVRAFKASALPTWRRPSALSTMHTDSPNLRASRAVVRPVGPANGESFISILDTLILSLLWWDWKAYLRWYKHPPRLPLVYRLRSWNSFLSKLILCFRVLELMLYDDSDRQVTIFYDQGIQKWSCVILES